MKHGTDRRQNIRFVANEIEAKWDIICVQCREKCMNHNELPHLKRILIWMMVDGINIQKSTIHRASLCARD